MGDLRNQLKKANLISKKDAKRLAHEERVARKKAGGAAGVEAQQAEHAAELRAKKDQQREADRKREEAERDARAAAAERAACEEILLREVQKPGRRGSVRWYFQLEDGRLPCLELSPAERLLISDGLASVVRPAGGEAHDYGLLRTELAQRVAAVFPERVVFGVQAQAQP